MAHKPLFLKVNEYALLKLHKGYSIPLTLGITKKLTQQYVGLFGVMERVGRLTYRLDIPRYWRICRVFSVAQLKRASDLAADFFQRSIPITPCHYMWMAIPISCNRTGWKDCLAVGLLKREKGHQFNILVKALDNASYLVRVYKNALRALSQRGR